MRNKARWARVLAALLGAGALAGVAALTACAKRDAAPSSTEREAAPAMATATAAPAPAAKAAADTESKEASGGKKEKKKEDGKEGEAKSWKRSSQGANASRLMVGDREQLPLKGVEARVTIEGFRARVLLDYHFYNDKGRQLEGTFQMRLPEEASPYYFAFGESAYAAKEVDRPPPFFTFEQARGMATEPEAIAKGRLSAWLQPKEARMVPRVEAAQAYEEAVRKRVDPALVEWQGAGVFSSRVFPLQPQKFHRIVLGYDTDLVRLDDDLEYQLELPEGVDASAVTVTVKKLPGVEVKASPEVAAVPDESSAHYRFERARTVSVRLKKAGTVAIEGQHAGRPYFAASVAPPLPKASAVTQDRAVFLLDTSLSSNPDKFNVWLKLLRGILDGNRGSLKRFSVLFFNAGATWYQPAWIDNTPEAVEALLKRCGDLALEGATDLGAALGAGARPAWHAGKERFDVFLLSDGASTWGEGDRYALSKMLNSGQAAALFGYTTGLAGADTGMLGHLARESGGAVFSLASESDVEATAKAHTQRPWRLREVKLEGASDLLLAGRPGVVFGGQRLLLVGRGAPKAGAKVSFSLEQDGRQERVEVPLDRVAASTTAGRLYGQVAVGQLEELLPANEAEAKSYASHFRVPGQSASLLMLETEEEYRRLNLNPEADALSVDQKAAAELVGASLRSMVEYLGDPKLTFLEMVRGLKRPPVRLSLPASVAAAIEKLPSETFAVKAPLLVPKRVDREGIPGSLLELLSMHQLDYDAVTREAERRRQERGPADALIALSSLVEESPGDAVLARDVGYTAASWGMSDQAYYLFRRLARARPYEPLNYQAMARTLQSLDRGDLALLTYELMLAGTWDGRFGDVREIATVEYLQLLRRISQGKVAVGAKELAAERLGQLGPQAPVQKADLVVLIGWNTNNSDVDLHVLEPSGEECYYGHRDTKSGGRITRDVTQGFGPEMYVLPKAPRGTYHIRAKYFAQERNRMSAATKVTATVIRGYGTPEEKVEEKVVTLATGKQMHDILDVEF